MEDREGGEENEDKSEKSKLWIVKFQVGRKNSEKFVVIQSSLLTCKILFVVIQSSLLAYKLCLPPKELHFTQLKFSSIAQLLTLNGERSLDNENMAHSSAVLSSPKFNG